MDFSTSPYLRVLVRNTKGLVFIFVYNILDFLLLGTSCMSGRCLKSPWKGQRVFSCFTQAVGLAGITRELPRLAWTTLHNLLYCSSRGIPNIPDNLLARAIPVFSVLCDRALPQCAVLSLRIEFMHSRTRAHNLKVINSGTKQPGNVPQKLIN